MATKKTYRKKPKNDRTFPTRETIRVCREYGYRAQDVEKYNFRSKRRLDLFGFIDIVCMWDDSITGIQATSRSNMSARLNKIVNECRDAATEWLCAGGTIEIWGWDWFHGEWRLKVWQVTPDLFA